MKQIYCRPVVEIESVSNEDVLLASSGMPDYRDDIFGQELGGSSEIGGGGL